MSSAGRPTPVVRDPRLASYSAQNQVITSGVPCLLPAAEGSQAPGDGGSSGSAAGGGGWADAATAGTSIVVAPGTGVGPIASTSMALAELAAPAVEPEGAELTSVARIQTRRDFAKSLDAALHSEAPPLPTLPKDEDGNPRFKGTWKISSNRYRGYGWTKSGQQSHMGMYPSGVLAARAADIYVLKCYGQDTKRLNFPLEVYSSILPFLDQLTLDEVVQEVSGVGKKFSKAARAKGKGAAAAALEDVGRLALHGSGPAPASAPDDAPADGVAAGPGTPGVLAIATANDIDGGNADEALVALQGELLQVMCQQSPATQVRSHKGIIASYNGNWHAKVYASGAPLYLGTYSTQEQAAKAVDVLMLKRDGVVTHYPSDVYSKLLPVLGQLSLDMVKEQICEVSRKLRASKPRKQQQQQEGATPRAAKKRKQAAAASTQQPDMQPEGS